MRVLQVVGHVAGGVFRHLEQLVSGLDEHRFILAGPPDVVKASEGMAAVWERWTLPEGHLGAPAAALSARRALRRRLGAPAGHGIDLIHLHGWWAGAALLDEARRHAPVVWTVHTLPPGGLLARLWVGRLLRAGGGAPPEVIAVSASLARAVETAWPGAGARVWTIRNGLGREELERLARRVPHRPERARRSRLPVERPPSPGLGPARQDREEAEPPDPEIGLPVPVLGFMGRLWGPKGALDAVEVLAILVRAGWPAVLEVAGEGPHRSEMARLARARGIEDRVAFLGWRCPDEFLARIDLLLHPSRAEGGFPYAVMEAMAAGVPVVAARVPAVEEGAGEGAGAGPGPSRAAGGVPPSSGVLQLAEPGDVMDLARATAACLSDPEGTARRAQAAAEHARRTFRLEETLEATRRVYRAALERAAARSLQAGDLRKPRQGLAGRGEPGV